MWCWDCTLAPTGPGPPGALPPVAPACPSGGPPGLNPGMFGPKTKYSTTRPRSRPVDIYVFSYLHTFQGTLDFNRTQFNYSKQGFTWKHVPKQCFNVCLGF